MMDNKLEATENPDRILNKDQVKKRIEEQDPNNNKNLPGKPVVKRRGKKQSDDGFEHRTSEETAR